MNAFRELEPCTPALLDLVTHHYPLSLRARRRLTDFGSMSRAICFSSPIILGLICGAAVAGIVTVGTRGRVSMTTVWYGHGSDAPQTRLLIS